MKAVPAAELEEITKAEAISQVKLGTIGGYDLQVCWGQFHQSAFEMAGLSAAWRLCSNNPCFIGTSISTILIWVISSSSFLEVAAQFGSLAHLPQRLPQDMNQNTESSFREFIIGALEFLSLPIDDIAPRH